jgi:hypothetical protein
MKHLTVLIASCLILVGCSFIQEKKMDVKACLADTACSEAAFGKAKANGEMAGNLASLSGIPAAPTVAKPVVSYISLLIFLCAMGATLRKKEPVVS